MDLCNYRELHLKEVIHVLETKDICNLGISSQTDIEITPMLFTIEQDDENLNLFFICSDTIVKELPNLLCIYLDNYISNFYRDAYQTILIKGKAEIITDLSIQDHIVSLFRKKYRKPIKKLISCSDLKYIKISADKIIGREFNYEL